VTRGTATGNLVAGKKVDAVVTGHIGRKSSGILKDAGVRILQGASGSVRDAVRMYRDGTLTEA
jgi:predicted Fe-Mo cluster-binding NifX family protein